MPALTANTATSMLFPTLAARTVSLPPRASAANLFKSMNACSLLPPSPACSSAAVRQHRGSPARFASPTGSSYDSEMEEEEEQSPEGLTVLLFACFLLGFLRFTFFRHTHNYTILLLLLFRIIIFLSFPSLLPHRHCDFTSL